MCPTVLQGHKRRVATEKQKPLRMSCKTCRIPQSPREPSQRPPQRPLRNPLRSKNILWKGCASRMVTLWSVKTCQEAKNSLKIKFLGRMFLGHQGPRRRNIPDKTLLWSPLSSGNAPRLNCFIARVITVARNTVFSVLNAITFDPDSRGSAERVWGELFILA